MMTLAHYQVVMYLLVGAVLFLLALTMGFDLGAAMLLPFLGKDNRQRRVVMNALGSTWGGNQIWLVAGGGALLVIWPVVYSLAFSGFYMVMIIMLWALFMRPFAFEWRVKFNSPAWRHLTDLALSIGSFVIAFMMGLLLGNLIQGVPFHFVNYFAIYTGEAHSLFNPFALFTGLLTVVMLLMHGAQFLKLTTDEVVARRARCAGLTFSLLFIALFAVGGFWVHSFQGYGLVTAAGLTNPSHNVVVRQAIWTNYTIHPSWLLAPIVAFFGALLALVFNRGAIGFVGSALACLGSVFTFGTTTFPFVMASSTTPNHSLTIWNATSSLYTLNAYFWAAAILVPIILAYTTFVYVKMSRRVTVAELTEKTNMLY